MDTVREYAHTLCAYDNNHVFDDVHLCHLHGKFKVSDEGPGLEVNVIWKFSDDVVVSVPEEYHESLLLPFPRNL